ncbi:hypothetical protein DYBT9275_05307 [Dyadobacter sp. CECT 9275]|uniref:Uncharacterized protein n=1 Tax=Dyadobacter helix TaxID=2822344 RepID=A0A916JG09_9BACT|nr:hypothetical protein [Dyadobacter sp. CECT 9275]CAG5012987.1 hypothetical protein DYBT9275_05307 [Dyadobacter sp. CECT 9275]
MDKKFIVTYNSDTIISDPAELATLCVFYDQVLLPWENPFNPSGFVKLLKSENGNYVFESDDSKVNFITFEKDGKVCNTLDYPAIWWEENTILFKESVLDQVPVPNSFTLDNNIELTDIARALLQSPHLMRTHSPNEFYVHRQLLLHLMRQDLDGPGIMSLNRDQNRATYTFYEAKSVFKYLIPKVNRLKPEEIMELRHRVKDTREGFSMHLQKLSLAVENALKENASLRDISYEAQKIIETDLIPDYYEFRRQLQFEKISTVGKLLELSGKFFEIDAAPWTPKFWGQLITGIGSTFSHAANKKSDLSNVQQSFKFMHICEEKS